MTTVRPTKFLKYQGTISYDQTRHYHTLQQSVRVKLKY